ncbi:TetR/AcrR family transcriptional regulator [Streptomonospora nanhaiensis]|uniref:TetR/AcrR family transcriptional regulator n=1 Tax=Streptomonospora nanhaiensis TaxID=1323731 RepID=UPI001C392D56|nr:TetR/AcrR family transcriptional regulator [Streptomonospora nanhaiensis]MBV2363660.1 TetR/AcrR family transcriptional regulator [Streptomonospora nanhaiensis]
MDATAPGPRPGPQSQSQPEPEPEPRPRRRDRAATRAALLDAARLRFGRHGYDGTGVRDIAADAGVDPALVFRYFGSKERLYAEAVRAEVPAGLAADRRRPLEAITADLLHDVVFADWSAYDGEHPLLVMLRSSGRDHVREQLRTRVCEDYLGEFTRRLEGPDAHLRAELLGALLLGMGVMRSLVGSPALGEASFGQARPLVDRVVAALARNEEGDR